MFGFNEAILSILTSIRNWDMEYMSIVAPAFNRTGDKSDGNFNPSTNITLSKNMYQFNEVNIPAGVTVSAKAPGLLMLANTVTIGGLLTASGLGASGGKREVVGNNGAGYVGGGGGGGSGYGALGGAGGAGRVAGGSGNTTYPAPGYPGADDIDAFFDIFNAMSGPVGGGGGGGQAGYDNYGMGGNGGGYIFIVANTVTISGAIRAEGLAGTIGASGQQYGGGGGGGGAIAIDCLQYNKTGVVSVAGGIGAGTTYKAGNGGAGYLRVIKRRAI